MNKNTKPKQKLIMKYECYHHWHFYFLCFVRREVSWVKARAKKRAPVLTFLTFMACAVIFLLSSFFRLI